MAIALWRLGTVVPAWMSGAPAAYPGQYVDRLYFALTEIPLLGAVVLSLAPRARAQPRWRRMLPWTLLTVSLVAMVLDARRL